MAPGSGRILILMCCYNEMEEWRCGGGTIHTAGDEDMESGTGSETDTSHIASQH